MTDQAAIWFSPDYDIDDLEDGPFYEDAEAALECGMTDEGLCMLAGTEHCDFECPYRDCPK